ncbi:HAD-IC family P-type ATPase [Rothia nasisuis]|uniref:HAD-IC family P-type ATPase n=1 Tax=Rothia nasisuis TaxID=2109647 RepID=UPI001F01A2C4|nr:HAD-IC family P-type ATPase [Rothia nasisuis]
MATTAGAHGAPPLESTAHALSAEQVAQELAVNPETGLDSAHVSERLTTYGPNRLPEPKKDSNLVRFMRQFQDIMIYVLLGSAVLTAFLGEWIDTFVILAVVIANAIIGYIQEGKSEAALDGIKNMLSSTASVRRSGAWENIDADQLVPGDLVRLAAGDKIPADIRILDAANLAAEESALTGESVPAEKATHPVDREAGLGDRTSMLFSGTLVSSGSARGLVVATGQNTQIGHINTMMSEVDSLETPLTRQISAFTKWLAIGVMVAAVLLGLIDYFAYGTALVEAVMGAVGFAVAAIPEGLPALITITLALGVQTLAQKKAITRKLPSVQTLGSVTVISSDKTGTLTKNEMTVTRAVTTAGSFEVEGNGYEPVGSIRPAGKAATSQAVEPGATVATLGRIMGVANETDVFEEEGLWKIAGEPTEGAVKTFSLKLGVDADDYRRTATLPFSSDYKFMATTVADVGSGLPAVLVKGAPDVLLARSNTQLTETGTEPLDATRWERAVDELSDQGLRVLAAAYRPASPQDATELPLDSVDDLIFVGLAGIVDPPRPEAIDAIEACHRAGITVKMITGDHAGTATAIARQMGIDDGAGAVTGAQIETASESELAELARRHNVFARTSPEHKLRLVKAMQGQGEIVAMTGDGVNDAPALRRADVGVAMGIKGTEVTKESAEVVLADDNFATIKTAVEEGRRIYDNLRKALVFLLVTNGAQSLVMLVAILAGWMLPLSPLQILWVNTVTAVTLAFAYAFEPAEDNVMSRPPQNPSHSIVRASHIVQIALASLLIAAATMGSFYVLLNQGFSTEVARTQATTVLVVAQAFYLFNVKALQNTAMRTTVLFNNRVAWLVVGILVALQLGFIYLPFMQNLFESTSLPARSYLMSLSLGLVVFFIIEAAKPLIYAKERKEAQRG